MLQPKSADQDDEIEKSIARIQLSQKASIEDLHKFQNRSGQISPSSPSYSKDSSPINKRGLSQSPSHPLLHKKSNVKQFEIGKVQNKRKVSKSRSSNQKVPVIGYDTEEHV